jgi:hypothetical protein
MAAAPWATPLNSAKQEEFAIDVLASGVRAGDD